MAFFLAAHAAMNRLVLHWLKPLLVTLAILLPASLQGKTDFEPKPELESHDFEVEDFHTYFVGEAGVWVHNEGEPCKRVFSIFTEFKKRNGGDAAAAWRSTETRLFGVSANVKDTSKTLGAALDDVLKKEILPDHPGEFFTSTSRLSESDNLGAHVYKHVHSNRDMADLAPDGITYVQRALDLSGNTTSTGNILVAEGVRARSGGQRARIVLNKTTGEFTIKVLEGPQAGRIQTLFRPHPEDNGGLNPLEYFSNEVDIDGLTIIE